MGALLAAATAGADRIAFTEVHMGVEVRVVICTENAEAAASAARAAFDTIHAWDLALSDWNPSSDAMLLPQRAGDQARVQERLAKALSQSAHWRARTGGAFDPALGALTRLWRDAARRDAWPDPGRLQAARDRCGWSALAWRPETSEFQVLREGVRMDFGGIGQGLAADEALAVLQSRGFPSAMVDISGDIALGTAPPGERGWRVAVEPAEESQATETLLLASCGVSCSGDRGQPRIIAGRRMSHILDPFSGLPVRAPRQAVVIAADATSADALATALCVLPPERCTALVALDAVHAARITRAAADGGCHALGGWDAIRPARADPAAAPSGPAAERPSTAPMAAETPARTAPAPR